MEKIILTREEIETITGRKRYTAQSRQLAKMGIEHRLNAAGEPIVSRQHFEQVMGVVSDSKANKEGVVSLNFDFLGDVDGKKR